MDFKILLFLIFVIVPLFTVPVILIWYQYVHEIRSIKTNTESRG